MTRVVPVLCLNELPHLYYSLLLPDASSDNAWRMLLLYSVVKIYKLTGHHIDSSQLAGFQLVMVRLGGQQSGSTSIFQVNRNMYPNKWGFRSIYVSYYQLNFKIIGCNSIKWRF